MNLKPEILTHPNIPKPLHGISPRTIMGQRWWDNKRQEVYRSTEYHCIACGVHKTEARGPKWLEAHESFEIDYNTGICTIRSIEPLCHYCHNFIHSGRLFVNDTTNKFKIDVLNHGFDIIRKNDLKCFYITIDIAVRLGIKIWGIKKYTPVISKGVRWQDWKIVFNDKEYRSKFKNYEEWSNFYSKG